MAKDSQVDKKEILEKKGKSAVPKNKNGSNTNKKQSGSRSKPNSDN